MKNKIIQGFAIALGLFIIAFVLLITFTYDHDEKRTNLPTPYGSTNEAEEEWLSALSRHVEDICGKGSVRSVGIKKNSRLCVEVYFERKSTIFSTDPLKESVLSRTFEALGACFGFFQENNSHWEEDDTIWRTMEVDAYFPDDGKSTVDEVCYKVICFKSDFEKFNFDSTDYSQLEEYSSKTIWMIQILGNSSEPAANPSSPSAPLLSSAETQQAGNLPEEVTPLVDEKASDKERLSALYEILQPFEPQSFSYRLLDFFAAADSVSQASDQEDYLDTMTGYQADIQEITNAVINAEVVQGYALQEDWEDFSSECRRINRLMEHAVEAALDRDRTSIMYDRIDCLGTNGEWSYLSASLRGAIYRAILSLEEPAETPAAPLEGTDNGSDILSEESLIVEREFFTLTLPETWLGNYYMQPEDEISAYGDVISLWYSGPGERGGGNLFYILVAFPEDVADWDDWETLGSLSVERLGNFVIKYRHMDHGYDEQGCAEQYLAMLDDIDDILSSITFPESCTFTPYAE